MFESSIYRPGTHGRVPLKAKWRGQCGACGWIFSAEDVSVGEPLPPEEIACPRCLLAGKWKPVLIVRV